MDEQRVSSLVREILLEIGEDPDREGLAKTPDRVARALSHLTRGYAQTPEGVVNGAVFESEGANHMVIVRDIDVYSLCEHHLMPFFGHCHVGYIPRGKVLGVSKIARAVREATGAEGVGVVMECEHLCMQMRGVSKQNSKMATSAVLGSFHDDAATRAEFLSLASRSPHS